MRVRIECEPRVDSWKGILKPGRGTLERYYKFYMITYESVAQLDRATAF